MFPPPLLHRLQVPLVITVMNVVLLALQELTRIIWVKGQAAKSGSYHRSTISILVDKILNSYVRTPFYNPDMVLVVEGTIGWINRIQEISGFNNS